ncbi:MAG: (2Fe-2S)-binding protein [Betaproteobacteria bacterium]|nr:(2Fe-2S)-binding protein [Pseudolabrys sp.]MSQ73952.1 (2Fe-2S)-binding protein [Betaproteobacteria bacterium]
MSEDCRTSHEHSDAHEHNHDHGPLTEIARTRATRRSFIKGVIASGATLGATGYLFRSGEAQARTAGVERLVSLKVNGQVRRVDVLPHETLANTLRYKLGLTGTKLSCDRGECGACTVMVGDATNYSCTTLTHSVADKEITTIEGIAKNGQLHPVQKAFIEEIGPQCGFCTPGQVISAVALLKANPNPTIEQARRAMSGNLCRCGSYQQYLAGVMRAAKGG